LIKPCPNHGYRAARVRIPTGGMLDAGNLQPGWSKAESRTRRVFSGCQSLLQRHIPVGFPAHQFTRVQSRFQSLQVDAPPATDRCSGLGKAAVQEAGNAHQRQADQADEGDIPSVYVNLCHTLNPAPFLKEIPEARMEGSGIRDFYRIPATRISSATHELIRHCEQHSDVATSP
jgi:hypothetical protein